MSISVDVQRLAVTAFVSLLLHLCLLSMISKALPGIGRADVFKFEINKSLQVTTNTYKALQETGLVGSDGNPVVSSDNQQGMQKLDVIGLLETDSVRQGLSSSIDVFDGPPYPPPEPIYWPAVMLEQPPRPIAELDTRFPDLDGRDAAGRMVFSILIDELGDVDEVLVEYSSLENSIVEHVQSKLLEMNFQAGKKEGLNVKSRVRVEVNFSYSVL